MEIKWHPIHILNLLNFKNSKKIGFRMENINDLSAELT